MDEPTELQKMRDEAVKEIWGEMARWSDAPDAYRRGFLEGVRMSKLSVSDYWAPELNALREQARREL